MSLSVEHNPEPNGVGSATTNRPSEFEGAIKRARAMRRNAIVMRAVAARARDIAAVQREEAHNMRRRTEHLALREAYGVRTRG